MFRIRSITSSLILVLTTFSLASTVSAGTVQDVWNHFGKPVAEDGSDPRDLNCDGHVGIADFGIARQVVIAHSAPASTPQWLSRTTSASESRTSVMARPTQ